jgi:hypothetical protein
MSLYLVSIFAVTVHAQAETREPEMPQRLVIGGYPRFALLGGIAGSVYLKIHVEESGRVAKVEAPSGAELLKGMAIRDTMKWRFAPGKLRVVDFIYEFEIVKKWQEDKYFGYRGETEVVLPNKVVIRAAELEPMILR